MSKVTRIPEEAGDVVGITQWGSALVIACENGVYIFHDGLGGPSRLVPLAIVEYSDLDVP